MSSLLLLINALPVHLVAVADCIAGNDDDDGDGVAATMVAADVGRRHRRTLVEWVAVDGKILPIAPLQRLQLAATMFGAHNPALPTVLIAFVGCQLLLPMMGQPLMMVDEQQRPTIDRLAVVSVRNVVVVVADVKRL